MTYQKTLKYSAVATATSLLLALGGCDSSIDKPSSDQYSTGSADFSSMVTVGDSLTAGFADSALYLNGQLASYPAILAGQISQVEPITFTQPLVDDNTGGLLAGGTPIATVSNRLVLTAGADGALGPAPIDGDPTTDIAVPVVGPFNNVGVPGAKSFHLVTPNYGDISALPNANPYFVRFASAAGTTVLADAVSQTPTFFTLWIGNNDTLSYATGGGVGVDQTGNLDPATYGSSDITDPTVFASTYNSLVTALTAAGAKGVLINLPDVTSIPFFTTVPYNAIPLDAETAAGVNAAFATYNGGLLQAESNGLITAEEAAARTVTYAAGNNAALITDEALTDLSGAGLPSIRQATAEDYILLTASSALGTLANPADATTVIGVAVPLSDDQVLTAAEAELTATANTAYNATIAAIANANPDLALYDAAAAQRELATTGIQYGTGGITAAFATGGGFSLDGVHPTERGYAVIANDLMGVIEDNFGATIPRVDPSSYRTVYTN
ncbi:MAG: hypothetical protein ACPGSC_08675 [Granulosicoccaceae bacterium]